MKKKSISSNLLIIIVAMMTSLFCGCAKDPLSPDVVTKWPSCEEFHLSEPMIADYKAYINTLSTEEKGLVSPSDIRFYDSQNGNHAVKIPIPTRHVWVVYLLIYDDENNARIKAIKYTGGQISS